MSDAMTNWSNFSNQKEEIEYEIRHKLSALITKDIETAISRGVNTHFISGLELANSIVLGFDPYENNYDTQPSLF